MIEQPGWRTRMHNLGTAVRLFSNWPTFVVNYLRQPRVPALYRLRNGTRLWLRAGTSDFRILREIVVHQEYERPGFEIGPTDVVVDIGAQIGVFSTRAARAAGQGRVFSFEPHPDNFRLLSQNLAANNFTHAQAVNRAVAAQAGRHTFYASAVNTGGHSLYQQPGTAGSFEVETCVLADFLAAQGVERIDYLKVDCEGAEREILSSLPAAWLDRVRRIVMEVHDPRDTGADGLAGWLQQRGFTVEADGTMVYARRAKDS